MDPYVTEDQQVEAIKQWWRDNGTSVILGAALGLSAVFGIRAWNEWRAGKDESASFIYQAVLQGIEKEDLARVQSSATKLREDYPGSVYAVLAVLSEAALMINKGDLAGARGQLEWAALQEVDSHLKGLAQIRLGRVMLDQGDPDRALLLAESAANAGFSSEAEELRGDVLRTQGDLAGARKAYQSALEKLPSNSSVNTELTQKIDDLGVE